MNASILPSLENDFILWLKKNLPHIKDPDEELLRRCFAYATKIYSLEKRKNGEYTLQTILRILETLTYTPADSLTYALAIFSKTDPIIAQDPQVAKLHKELPLLLEKYYQLSGLKINPSDSRFSDDLAKMFFTIADSPRVTLVRLADRLVNLQTSSAFDADQQKLMAEKSLALYSPLAQILGLKHIYTELQDEAFRLIHPEIHTAITHALTQLEGEYTPQLVKTIQQIHSVLDELNIEHTLNMRVKKAYSVYKKMLFKYPETRPADTENLVKILYDIIGIRVIVPSVTDCYAFISDFQHDTASSLSIKDYIQYPKPNGYQSIHCLYRFDETVRIEIQVRTLDMHEKNEFGDASHFYYKVADPYSKKTNPNNWLKNIVEWQENVQGSSLEEVGYFQKYIYTLTPKRDVIQLPAGATALDFAYAIHQDVGNHAVQAYINGKLVPLDHQLKNGDSVQIKIGKRETPPTKFIHAVKTREAKKALSRYLRRVW